MLTFEPGDSFAHRLDPRAKLAIQIAVAVAAFAHTTPRGLAVLSVVVAACLAAARLDPRRALWAYRFALPFLVVAPVLAVVELGPPWLDPAAAVTPLLSGYRVVLVLLVGGAYVRTTEVRESRAAIQWAVPGRPGQFLALGVGLVFRFLPLLRRDLLATREAMDARLAARRPLHERIRRLTTAGLRRVFGRADRLTLALRARCLAWNPTLPPLTLAARDLPALCLALGLLVWAVV